MVVSLARPAFSSILGWAFSLWRAIPHNITELVKKTKITPAHWRNFSSLLEISPAYWKNFSSLLERFLQPTGEISPA